MASTLLKNHKVFLTRIPFPSVKRIGRIRTGIRTAAKVLEKDLISKAKKLREEPKLILPKCEGNCKKCVFTPFERRIGLIQKFKDDEKKLSNFARHGDQFCRAYAATLLLAISEKAPYLAVARTPYGNISYAVRGKVKKEKLIGMQYFNDPKWRLMSVYDLASKKHLYIYSTREEMICTGTSPNPPRTFVNEMINKLKYRLNNAHTCQHLSPDHPEKETYLSIKWLSADVEIAVCEKCLKDDENMLNTLVQRIAAHNPSDDFEVNVIFKLICKSKCGECGVNKEPKCSSKLIKDYKHGVISDNTLVQKFLKDVEVELKSSRKQVFVSDNECYGDDLISFVDDLHPSKIEREGLQGMLKEIDEPVVIKNASPNKVFTTYWTDHGQAAIYAIVKDKDLAEELFEKADIQKNAPSFILKNAATKAKRRDILSSLPEYKTLPSVAKFADDIAKIYKTKGKEKAIRFVEKHSGRDTKIKSIGYAFLLAMGQTRGKEWQYNKTEIDFASYLKDFASRLLNAEPKEYHKALKNLLAASGSTEKITLDD